MREKFFPARLERFGQQRVGLEDAFADLVEERENEDDTKHDEEGKLEAGLKKLARFPHKNDDGSGEKGIEEIAGTFQKPAAEDDEEHDDGADGGGGPAGHGGIKENERNRQQGAISRAECRACASSRRGFPR